jgi:cell division protein WhiA
MSFSSDVREELARSVLEKKCCAHAELAGMALSCGALSFRGAGRYQLTIGSESAAVARRYFLMAKETLGVTGELRAVKTDRLGGRARYLVSFPDEDAQALMNALMLYSKNEPLGIRRTPHRDILRKSCCRLAVLRGAYLAGGSINNPEHAYHMEIAVSDEEMAQAIVKLMEGFSLPARTSERKRQYVVYLKDGEHIVNFLTLLGAYKAVLAFENVRILKGVRNGVNRQVNCDNNNLEKSLEAAERQISIIEWIDKKQGLDSLPPQLEEVARLRLQYPDVSFTELGGMLEPPLGKSGISARMRKLEALAEDLANS